ncbi:rhamnogalacturonan lyase [Croceibacterium mercuriale]|uniref:rhamnogalacturonan lyase n=1 Tax=Croceibacterium mercuriale TaxID=1572751 RepID=UPI0009DCF34D|nr:rhamnogalacturonan lyase [Croceibacterium mercuriale]
MGVFGRKRILLASAWLAATAATMVLAAPAAAQQRQMETLDRGLVVVPALEGGNLVSWRMLRTDSNAIRFNVYRDGTLLNPTPIADRTNLVDTGGSASSTYTVRAVLKGIAEAPSASAGVWTAGYLSIPLSRPTGASGVTYSANDASVGDLDGDGRYEVVLKWDPSNAKDNSQSGVTGDVFIDAYRLDGTRLWRINLGRNIRAGAHYTQFMVYDFDGDGKAEVMMKTADATVDGVSTVIGDAAADYRNSAGYVLAGPEYLSVFNGQTGAAMATIPYNPPRHPDTLTPTPSQINTVWGDNYGNRVDRFLAGVAYFDGSRPSAVFARGYYTRTTLWAVDWRNGQLTQRWFFDSNVAGSQYRGQGNHQLAIADVDSDGKDEIIYGAMALDDNGTALWNSNLKHGDAMHVTDHIPSRPGLEKYGVHEDFRTNGGIGSSMLDARTGQVIWSTPASSDIGRGVAMDIDPRHPGSEAWAASSNNLYTATGELIGTRRPSAVNFGIWWDGDLLRELQDQTRIDKWNWEAGTATRLLTADGTVSVNGTKANPSLTADILGDWREETILPSTDSSELRIYATPYSTTRRLRTLMHDPVYRMSVAWQNVAYNQPPHTGFYLGEGANLIGK